jgi:transposase InsO family protein
LQRSDVAFKISRRNAYRTKKHKRYVLDSGATITCINRLDLFESIECYRPGKKVQVANKQFLDVVCIGTIKLECYDRDHRPYTILLSNVHYSPDFQCNLLSVDELWKQHGISSHFSGESYLQTKDGVHLPIERDQKEFVVHAFYAGKSLSTELWHRRLCHIGKEAMQRVQCKIGMSGSFDYSQCDACLQGGTKRLPYGTSKRRSNPDAAFRRHAKRQRFTYFGERVACDLCDMEEQGIDGERYAILFFDSYTTYSAVYCLRDKTKETVMQAFQQFLSDHQDRLVRGVGTFWTDNGGEFQNSDMDAFCEEICTKRAWTVPYSSPQNPYAERAWGVALRKVRTCLAASGAPNSYWPYLIKHAVLVHNIIPDENCTTPYEIVHGEDYDYNKLHVPLCLCYYVVPDRDRASKLSPRALPARYLGPDPGRNGHIVEVPKMGRITSAYHVVFNEHRYYHPSLEKPHVYFEDESNASHESSSQRRRVYREERDTLQMDRVPANVEASPALLPVPLEDDLRPADDTRHGTVDGNVDGSRHGTWSDNHCGDSRCLYPNGHSGPHSYEDYHENGEPRGYFRRRPAARQIYDGCPLDEDCAFCIGHCGPCEDDQARPIFDDFAHQIVNDSVESSADMAGKVFRVPIDDVVPDDVVYASTSPDGLKPPSKYSEAIVGPLRERWKTSMQEEIFALVKNGTWELVSRNDDRLRGRKITKSRWVYDIKYNRDGTISRFKSRFVVCGYSQREGIDYDRAFSATLRATTFRTLLAVAAGKKLRLVQYDVSNAFTQAAMDDVDLFVEPPPGHEEWEYINGKRVSKVLLLKRALYGTKQASRLWQETLRKALEEIGFEQSSSDPCLYRWVRKDGQEIILGVYVDDIVLAYSHDEIHEEFKHKFCKRFAARYEGPLKWFLGMAIDQDEKTFAIQLDHQLNIDRMVEKFIPHNSVTRECPPKDIFDKLDRAKSNEDRAKVETFPYKSLIGSLLYVAVMSRPDIAFHTSVLAKFMSDPSPECCKAAVELLQYLGATSKRKMEFTGKIDVPSGLEKHASDITSNHGFVAYSDSSWGNAYPYPMFGYGVYLFGGLVSFASKQLKTVAFSSCEAEYAAASYCCKEIEFVRNVCADCGVILQGRLILAVDNTAAIDTAHNVGVTARTKHFERAIHYLRDLTQLKRILPCYVSTTNQRADGYTKSLDKSKFVQWVPCVIK